MDGQFNHLNLAPELFINGDNAWLRETYNDNDLNIDDLREQTVLSSYYTEAQHQQQKDPGDEAWQDLLEIYAQKLKPK